MSIDELTRERKTYLENRNFDLFWGEWLKGKTGKGSSESSKWENWLGGKGLSPDEGESAKEGGHSAANGWTDPNDDLSDLDDDAWNAGGMRRPGEKDSEEFSSEEAMDDEWADDDDDDDDHGGQMMPIPSMF